MKTTLLTVETLVIGSVLDLTLCKVKVESAAPISESWTKFKYAYEVTTLKTSDVCLEKFKPCSVPDADIMIVEHSTCPMGFKRLLPDPPSVQFQQVP